MLAISRFRVDAVDADRFEAEAGAAASRFAASAGCLGAELVRNLDDPALWALVSRWSQVGDYRRAFNGTDAKLVLLPLLGRAIDEPSAYAEPETVGENLPRGQ